MQAHQPKNTDKTADSRDAARNGLCRASRHDKRIKSTVMAPMCGHECKVALVVANKSSNRDIMAIVNMANDRLRWRETNLNSTSNLPDTANRNEQSDMSKDHRHDVKAKFTSRRNSS